MRHDAKNVIVRNIDINFFNLFLINIFNLPLKIAYSRKPLDLDYSKAISPFN